MGVLQLLLLLPVGVSLGRNKLHHTNQRTQVADRCKCAAARVSSDSDAICNNSQLEISDKFTQRSGLECKGS